MDIIMMKTKMITAATQAGDVTRKTMKTVISEMYIMNMMKMRMIMATRAAGTGRMIWTAIALDMATAAG
jgi:hypothetical protein